MFKSFKEALLLLCVLTVITGVFYPLAVTGVSQVLFARQANGSIVTKDGQPIGSLLIAQNFTNPEYFHPRPSAAGDDGYDATSSSGTNLGPTSQKLMASISDAADAFRQDNNLAEGDIIPSDAVTSSGSGLDPDISLKNAYMQINRVAAARNMPPEDVKNIVDEYADRPALGILGEPKVNVLALNLLLDDMDK